jgi:hypothetical protein
METGCNVELFVKEYVCQDTDTFNRNMHLLCHLACKL